MRACIHFDIDAAEVGKIRHAEIPVVGPLEARARRARRCLACTRAEPKHGPWLAQLDEWRELYPYRYTREAGVLKPQTAIESLRDLTASREEDVIWTTGVGQHQMWAMQYLQCDKPRSFITSGGLGTMGYGIPAAIGAKAARPDATVICIDGDGCFQMTCQELATAALERLPIVPVIVNNGWLGMVRQWQEMFYDERFAQTHLTQQVPEYAALAEAYGCAGFTVEHEDGLEAALQAALDCGRSAVVDVRCDPAEKVFPMVPSGAAAVDVLEAPEEESGFCMSSHTISVRLENSPGALARVSQLFSRRGYNIQSLAVGPTESPDISRLTLRVDCSEHSLEQIEKQMHKLVNVLRVTELRPDEAVERELALITVAVKPRPPRRADRAHAGLRRIRSPTSDVTPSRSRSSAGPTRSTRSKSSSARTVYASSRGPAASACPARAPARPPRHPHSSKKGHPPMAEIHKSGDPSLLGKVAVLGYGSQGHAHALNLHDSGVEVEVGLREGSALLGGRRGRGPDRAHDRRGGARRAARRVPRAGRRAAGALGEEVAPNLEPGAALLFAHGFNVHYDRIAPPEGHDVIMVAPKGPGHVVRTLFTEGYGTPAVVAVAQDASGHARELAFAYGAGIGAARVGMVETTFQEETETDLFGEQTVLCGGVTQLIQLGFETLVEAGYQPEVAYYECLHELKLIVDLIWAGRDRADALLDLRHRRVRLARGRPEGRRRARAREHARGARARSRTGRSRATGWPRWIAASRCSTSTARSSRRRELEQVGARLRALNVREEAAEVHGVG